MRWLFLIVLVANIAYITWQLNVSEEEGYAGNAVTGAVASDTQSIVLLSELKAKKNSASVTSQPDSSLSEKTQLPDEEKNPAIISAVKAISAADKKSDVKVSSSVAQEKSVVVVATALLSGQVDTQADAQASSCYTIGPFRDLEKLRGFVREIKPYVVEADFRNLEEKRRSVYWVYLKPEKSRKQAKATSRRLKTKKIKDFYIIREGEKNNGISLGHFKNKKRAYGLAKKVKKLGFDVVVEPLFKTYILYWLDYQLGNGNRLPKAVVDKYLQTNSVQAKGKDKISRLSRDCAS